MADRRALSLGIAMATVSLSIGPGLAVEAVDPLTLHRWNKRIVVALGSSWRDPDLVRQRSLFDALGPAALERDLILVEAVDGSPEGLELRRRLGGSGFKAGLIGKDGGVKLVSGAPLGADRLLPLIDAMPMRQQEMRRR